MQLAIDPPTVAASGGLGESTNGHGPRENKLNGILPGTEPVPADLEKLEARSWITPELASKAHIRRVNSPEGAACVGRKNNADYSGLFFPYIFPGESNARGGRLRRDSPDIVHKADGSRKEENKYLTAPGTRLMLYITPGTPPVWLADTNLPVIMTEGEKKTLALHRAAHHESPNPRFLPVGIAGVSAWRGKIGIVNGPDGRRQDEKGPIPDLDRLAWNERKVVICFDSDVDGNDFVKRERRLLSQELKRRGASVLHINVPKGPGDAKQGVDDWLAAAGPEVVLDAIRNAEEAHVTVPTGFSLTDNGVFAVDPTGEKDPVFICEPLQVVACTRDADHGDWGRLLRWHDLDGHEHEWAMPMSLLAGDGAELRARLLDGGLGVSPNYKARQLLVNYIQTAKPTAKRRAVAQIGWHGDVFVLPDRTFGVDDELVLYQSAHDTDHRYRTAGNLSQWTETVGACCRNNSLLIFGVSSAFAGPLLGLAGSESGGFHLRGGSSTGKTTILRAAGSVMGGGADDGFLQSWRATSNGLEAVAALHNDSILLLDELSQVDPRVAGEVAYLLANGRGKARMNRSVGARKTATWRLIFLSSGEISLADHVKTAGQRVRAGQEVRLVELDADAGAGLGAFQDLHGAGSAAEFADTVSRTATTFYGTPLQAFLGFITRQPEEVRKATRAFLKDFVATRVPPNACGEVSRAALRFALVGAAGELATDAGITGWPEGESIEAAGWCFNRWLVGRNSNEPGDADSAIRQVRRFIENHGQSRFQQIYPTGDTTGDKILNRAGFRKTDLDQKVEYLVFPETFKDEVCHGFDPRMVAAELERRGFLTVDGSGKRSVRVEAPEGKRLRVYAIRAAILEAE